jgi:probable HAF family extracellular repeat protein
MAPIIQLPTNVLLRRFLFHAAVVVAALLALSRMGYAESYTFTQFDVPGAALTNASGINNAGQIVGQYTDSTGRTHGFLYSGGTFTTLDVPGSSDTFAAGINDVGQIVGGYFAGTGTHGFLYSGGTFATLDVPGSFFTTAKGINNAGQIVGDSYLHGFFYSGGTFAQLDVPGAENTNAIGINNLGQILGFYRESTGGSHNFLASDGIFTSFDVPGGGVASGINDAGEMVGYGATLLSCGVVCIFTYDSFVYSGGIVTPLQVPGTGDQGAQANGINNAGQIVGANYYAGTWHAFLATPVASVAEPASLSLLSIGLVITGLSLKRRRRRSGSSQL